MKEQETMDRRDHIIRQLKALFLQIEKEEDPDGLRDVRAIQSFIDRQVWLTAYSLYKTSHYSLSYIADTLGISKQALYNQLSKLKRT